MRCGMPTTPTKRRSGRTMRQFRRPIEFVKPQKFLCSRPFDKERQVPSPMERMIDAACGLRPGEAPPSRPAPVKLECPKCAAERMVERSDTDPPNTYIVQLTCPKCHDAGDFQEVNY